MSTAPQTFRQLVKAMRHAQQMFYQHRNRAWLNEARKLERQVDKWLERHADEQAAVEQLQLTTETDDER
jgi:hypothetical protein